MDLTCFDQCRITVNDSGLSYSGLTLRLTHSGPSGMTRRRFVQQLGMPHLAVTSSATHDLSASLRIMLHEQ